MEIISSTLPEKTAADVLAKILISHTSVPLLLMLSGGSALKILTHLSPSLFGPHITITTLDERFSTEANANNFTQIAVTPFFESAINNGAKIISTVIHQNETLAEASQRFSSALYHWISEHPRGVVIATIGIGSDGHTAGIFPGDQVVDFNNDEWVQAYRIQDSSNPFLDRITVSYTFMRKYISAAVGILSGQEKAHILSLLQNETSSSLPVNILKEIPTVTLITDILDR